MAELEYFVVAEDASIDQGTNRTSVFSVLEEIGASRFPVLFQRMVAVTLWRARDEELGQDFQSLLRIVLPDGEIHTSTANFTFRNRRHRILLRVEGLPLTQAGELRFEIHLNGDYVSSHTVDITERDEPHESEAMESGAEGG